MQNNQARRASIALGVFMAIVLIAGAILPLANQNATVTDTTEATNAPTATFPPPITDFATIDFDTYFLHPSGLYAIAQPDGWSASEITPNPSQAQVNFINEGALSVIDAYVERAANAPVTVEELSSRFTQEVLDASWANFNNWRETFRRTEEDRLLIDFVVTLTGQQYVARQIVTTDGEWIYVTRVLAPDNATALITYLLDTLPTTYIPFKQFSGTPFEWLSYYDDRYHHIIRFPSDWQVTDSAPGRPASINSADGVSLRVIGYANRAAADDAAARPFIESERPGATVLSVEPTTRGDVSGFSVAYSFANTDGEAQSGLAVLLNGADGTLHVANLYFPAANIDLNTVDTLQEQQAALGQAEVTPEATGEVADAFGAIDDLVPSPATGAFGFLYTNYATVMSTFSLLPVINLSADSLPPATPTLIPTPAPVESTAEVTSEATSDIEPTVDIALTDEATPEVEASATMESTTEATAEATAEATP